MDINNHLYILGVIGIMSGATFLCRSMPFYILKKWSGHPMLNYVGRMMPPMIMMLLVFYTLVDVNFKKAPYGLEEICAGCLTLLLHIFFNNSLLSIGASTALYMFLKQTGLLEALF